MMATRWYGVIFLVFCFVLSFVPTSFSKDDEVIPCEVLEVSGAVKGGSAQLKRISYILLQHANSADRERLSEWLKVHNGEEVVFKVKAKEYEGVIFRMSHCFGRGLIIHMHVIQVKKRDIIELVLSSLKPKRE